MLRRAARPAVALLLRAAVALLLVGRVSSQAAVDGDWVFDDSRTDTCTLNEARISDASCDCKYHGPDGSKTDYRIKYTIGGSGALHGNAYLLLDGGYGASLRPEQVHMRVSEAACGGDQASQGVTERVLAGGCKDFDDNPTCLDDGPCLDHGGFDFAAQKLVSRTPTGGLRIDFPVGYDEATWGLLYVFVCAAPKTCTSLSVI